MAEGGAAASLAMSEFLSELTGEAPLPELISNGIRRANLAVYSVYRGRGGTTLTAVAVDGRGNAWSVHAGDSRLYGFSQERVLELLSLDDTINAVVNRENPQENEDNLDNRLLQFVGVGPDFSPHLLRMQSGQDQTWMLTSDGIHSLGKRILHNVTQHAKSGIDVARKLLFVVDASPMGDNATVVCITPKEFQPPKRFHGGITLTVWTAETRVELWVSSETEPRSHSGMREAQPEKSNIAPPEKKAAKPKARTKPAKKPARKSAKPAPDEAAAPLLRVVLGDRIESDD